MYTLESVSPLTGERTCHAAGTAARMRAFRRRYRELAKERGRDLRVWFRANSAAARVIRNAGECDRDPGRLSFDLL
jgi:hypothetical protein